MNFNFLLILIAVKSWKSKTVYFCNNYFVYMKIDKLLVYCYRLLDFTLVFKTIANYKKYIYIYAGKIQMFAFVVIFMTINFDFLLT